MKLRTRITAIVGTLLLGIVGALALAAPASAGTYGHYIVHATGLCLEVPSTNQGEQLRLNYCTGTGNQYFYFEDAPGFDYNYFIHPAQNYRYCLVAGVANLMDSTIVQWPCSGQAPQVWRLAGSASGNLILQSPYSGLCIGAQSVFPGVYVRQNGCVGASRTWILT